MSHCERKRAAASAAYKHFPGPGGLGKSCLRGNSLAPEAVEKRGPRRRRSLFRGKHACAEPDTARGAAVPGQPANFLKGGAACPTASESDPPHQRRTSISPGRAAWGNLASGAIHLPRRKWKSGVPGEGGAFSGETCVCRTGRRAGRGSSWQVCKFPKGLGRMSRVARDKNRARASHSVGKRGPFFSYAASGQGSASAQGGVIGTKAAGSGVRRKSSATAQTLSTQLTTKDSR